MKERLWGARDALALASGGDAERAARLDAEIGYGLASPGTFTSTPYAGLQIGEGGREYRTGWRMSPGTSGLDVALGVEGAWAEPERDGKGAERSVMLRGALRW